jgi:lipopolysaccharide transport system permease protein
MSSASQSSAVTIPTLRIAPPRGWFDLKLAELWHARELLYFFVWRDIKIRYKQTAIGAAWAVLQPLLSMVLLTLFLGSWRGCPRRGCSQSERRFDLSVCPVSA